MIKKLPWSRNNLPPCQPLHHQLNKRRMMVTSKLSRKSKPRWLLLKLQWIRVFRKQIIELLR